MKLLQEYFDDARQAKAAIGHFNFSTSDQLRGIVEASTFSQVPCMVATSEGEARFLGYRQAVALAKSYQYDGVPLFLNADHHKTLASVKKAIDSGYDTVLIDASHLSLEENIALTRDVVRYAKSVNPSLQVEGELGYLRGSSEIQKSVPIRQEDYTKPEEAKRFVLATGIDRLAIVFGNIHGIVSEQEEKLDIGRLEEIVSVLPDMTLVLHGASGLADEDVKKAIESGITNVHFNTELRIAYHSALQQTMKSEPDQTTPYAYLEPAQKALSRLVADKIKILNSSIS